MASRHFSPQGGRAAMIRAAALLLCLAWAALPVRQAFATNVFGADLVGFGLYRTAKSGETKDDKVRTGKVLLVDVIHNIRRGADIPMTTAAEFGLEFVVKGVPKGAPVPIRVNLSHPFVIDPATGKSYSEAEWEMRPPLGIAIYTGWAFSQPWEMAEGQWIFRIYHDKRLLLEKAFNLYKPERQAPQEDELFISLDQSPQAPAQPAPAEKPQPAQAKAGPAPPAHEPDIEAESGHEAPYQAKTPAPRAVEPPVYVVQLGAFLNRAHADELRLKLKKKGYSPRLLGLYDKRDRLFHIVILDRYDTRAEAAKASAAYRKATGKKPYIMKMDWALYKTALSR